MHLIEQRPWSEWSRSDECCLQHAGHDVEQVQDLYSMTFTVNYFLSACVDILHSCVYPELISLLADVSTRITAHGLKKHHKFIVDSPFIAVSSLMIRINVRHIIMQKVQQIMQRKYK